MELDSIAKIAQVIFYIGGLFIGFLTYRRAKTTILNTVNTEYHKKVIERLADVSEELYKEFDTASDDVWWKDDDVGKVVDRLHEGIIDRKEEILADGKIYGGIPISPKQKRLSAMIGKYKSDPFLPDAVRSKVLDYLERRESAMDEAYYIVLEDYRNGLAEGKYWSTLDQNKHWISNQILDRLRAKGLGIPDVEAEVHEIRHEVQRYFQKFSPIQ
jgi:hypothetical protein